VEKVLREELGVKVRRFDLPSAPIDGLSGLIRT
jgi:hypothetical protein